MKKKFACAILAAFVVSLNSVNALAVTQAYLDATLTNGNLPLGGQNMPARNTGTVVIESPAAVESAPQILTYPGKGILYYPAFEDDIPDLAVFLKIPDENKIYMYPSSSENFHYIAEPSNSFTYTKQIWDYTGLNSSEMNRYKAYLVKRGFKARDSIDVPFPEFYADKLNKELLSDVDFALSKNGVYVFDDDTVATTLVVLFGKSVTYEHGEDGILGDKLVNCDEIRMYSIKQSAAYTETADDFSQSYILPVLDN